MGKTILIFTKSHTLYMQYGHHGLLYPVGIIS